MKQVCTMMFSLFIANPIFTKSFFLHKNSINNCVKNGIIIKNSFVHYSKKSDKYKNNEFSQIEKNTRTGNNEKEELYKPKTENQEKYCKYLNDHRVSIVFAVGPAGTGKTYTAVALAVRALKDKQVKKIIITRPAVEAGENLGFLPGDLKEKIDPYLRPIYDALEDMIQSEKLKFYIENRTIEIAPLAYMRGRTLNNAFILLDEAQNTTPMQIKMFLTRMGPLSKAIITGDKTQIDLPTKQKSGLNEALHILKDIKGIGFIELDDRDVVRHKLVRDILKAYEKAEAN